MGSLGLVMRAKIDYLFERNNERFGQSNFNAFDPAKRRFIRKFALLQPEGQSIAEPRKPAFMAHMEFGIDIVAMAVGV